MKSPVICSSLARAAARLIGSLGIAVLAASAFAAEYVGPGTVDETRTFINRYGTTTPFSIYLPPGYDPAGTTRYPVVYHLHGKGLNSTHAGDQTKHVPENFDAALATPGLGIEPVIIVFPDGHAADANGSSGWSNSGPGVTPYVPAEDDVHDLIAHIDANYLTKADREHRVIQGFSMGGGGAAKFASKYPEKFCAWVGYDAPLNKWAEVNQAYYGNSETYFNTNGNPWHQIDVNRANIIAYGIRYRQVFGNVGNDVTSPYTDANPGFRSDLISYGITTITGQPEYIYYDLSHSVRNFLNANGTDSWVFIQSIFDAAGSAPTTVSFNGLPEDGWVLESTETSGAGGSNNGGGQHLLVGDSANRQQYRAIVSFDTSTLPDGATITAATLKLRRTKAVGTVTSGFGLLQAAITNGTFGAASIENSDFSAAPDASGVATLNIPTADGDLASGDLDAAGLAAINRTGKTQFRIAFTIDDDNDAISDRVDFGSGNNTANLPVLEITYQ